MLQWRNWHTRQIQTLFSPGSTPGWSTIFEINSGGDFVNNISAVAIGMLIAAHREGDEEKFRAYVELIAETYEQQGNDHAANIIRSYYTGDYGEQGKVMGPVSGVEAANRTNRQQKQDPGRSIPG